jgi:hypothetical protein
MFVRVAQFDAGTTEGMDERVAAIKAQVTSTDEMPPGLAGVKRVVLLVDRDGGHFANLVYCDTREDLEAADAALNEMSPPGEDTGRRTSVTKYEIALDHSAG